MIRGLFRLISGIILLHTNKVKIMTTPSDWLLAAVSHGQAAGGLSPVQIQKIMFLFKEGAGDRVGKEYYDFEPYNYGPFCASIYGDLDKLIAERYVSEDRSPNRRWSQYQITIDGQTEAERILAHANNDQLVGFLERTVRWVQEKSFPELLQAIYKKFPLYKVNSIFAS